MDHLAQLLINLVDNYGYRPLFLEEQNMTYYQFMNVVKQFRKLLIDKEVTRGDNIVLIGNNTPNFLAVCFATWSLGAVLIPMYEKQNLDVKKHIISETNPKLIFNSTKPVDDTEVEQINHITCSFNDDLSDEFTAIGSKDDVAVIIYTSGTTGLPKGVMLSHFNLISNMKSADKISREFPVTVEDVYVSILPWSHVYGLAYEILFLMWKGASTHLNSDLKQIRNDFLTYNPTIICVVPKLLTEIAKTPSIAWLGWRHCPTVVRWMAGVKLQIFGITECAPLVSLNTNQEMVGSVGQILDCNEVVLSSENKEILVNGSNVFLGYYNNPEATNDAFVTIGDKKYFKTGDQGHIDSNDCLYITTRIKETFKLDNGKFCNPVPIEATITKDPNIKFAMIYAHGEDVATRLIVSTELTKDQVREIIIQMDIDKILMPSMITTTTELFTVENNLVTPKQSLKRNEIMKRYNL